MVCVGLSVALWTAVSSADDVPALISKLKAVGKEGVGNEPASQAAQELTKQEPRAIIELLRAMDDDQLVASNWLRGVVDAIAERALQQGQALPAAELDAFVRARQHAGIARRLAFEWLTRVDATAADRLVPGMLDDPAGELRREAVAREIDRAQQRLDANDRAGALAAFQKTFSVARDRRQVDQIAKQIKSLGRTVDLVKHYGLIRQWQLIAPFDNTDEAGFDQPYPPEQGIDLKAEYPGKAGPVRWATHESADAMAVVDLNKVIGKHMGVVAYALGHVESPKQQRVCIRAGTPNAVKIWLNGQQVFFREEYHHGMDMDQHRTTGILQPGRNTILVKICQNEQTEEWAQNWMFQVRVCDFSGGGL
jgi:hypothetical protein